MTRFTAILLAACVTISACSGPVATRVQTLSEAALPDQRSYMFSAKPEQDNDMYRAALTQLSDALESKGFQQASKPAILVDVALSDRPASIAITAGEKDKKTTVALAKQSKLLQSCADREHRLILTMLDRKTGAKLYQGMASEYHCKGSMNASLPHLVRAAVVDIGMSPGGGSQYRSISHGGVD